MSSILYYLLEVNKVDDSESNDEYSLMEYPISIKWPSAGVSSKYTVLSSGL